MSLTRTWSQLVTIAGPRAEIIEALDDMGQYLTHEGKTELATTVATAIRQVKEGADEVTVSHNLYRVVEPDPAQ